MSKTRKYIVIVAKVVFTTLFSMLIFSMGFNFLCRSRMIPLPMGYRMWQTDEQEQIIEIIPGPGLSYEENNRLIPRRVGPDVDRFRVYDKAIIGHVKKSGEFAYVGTNPGKTDNDDDFTSDPKKPGYFMIDLIANKVYGGLGKTEWNERLKKLGIESDPKLLEPTLYNKYIKHGRF